MFRGRELDYCKSLLWCLSHDALGLTDHNLNAVNGFMCHSQHKLVFNVFLLAQRLIQRHGQNCSENVTCCLTEREVADENCFVSQSQNGGFVLTSRCVDPIMEMCDRLLGCHLHLITGFTWPREESQTSFSWRRRISRKSPGELGNK